MQIRTTARFVDRERLAANPADPNAADTPAGTTMTVTAVRALEIIDTGFALPIGIDRAGIEALALVERQEAMAALFGSFAVAPSTSIDATTVRPPAQPDDVGTAETRDGGSVDLTK
ncbi:hypothetical protein [Sphingomonas sp. Leaf4]|uniref:hypothetical protein n=1 Tax=Sphingomonas sp. Leaf4 TaxID=2876553 RepID=UPI001E367391|nr:hypothetical protein [Sphingomonas sp. Leaf4]